MSDDDLKYRVPPQSAHTARRVYVLPRELVKRVHDYGFESGHPSEVSAVQELLEFALDRHGFSRSLSDKEGK